MLSGCGISHAVFYQTGHDAPLVYRSVPADLLLFSLPVHFRSRLSRECLHLIRDRRQWDFRESSNLSLPAVQSCLLRKASSENADGQHGSSSCVSDLYCGALPLHVLIISCIIGSFVYSRRMWLSVFILVSTSLRQRKFTYPK